MAWLLSHKEDVQKRSRVEGQVRGLQRIVGEDAYCTNVLTQISAATKALQSVPLELLGEHLSQCVQDSIQAGGPEADSKRMTFPTRTRPDYRPREQRPLRGNRRGRATKTSGASLGVVPARRPLRSDEAEAADRPL